MRPIHPNDLHSLQISLQNQDQNGSKWPSTVQLRWWVQSRLADCTLSRVECSENRLVVRIYLMDWVFSIGTITEPFPFPGHLTLQAVVWTAATRLTQSTRRPTSKSGIIVVAILVLLALVGLLVYWLMKKSKRAASGSAEDGQKDEAEDGKTSSVGTKATSTPTSQDTPASTPRSRTSKTTSKQAGQSEIHKTGSKKSSKKSSAPSEIRKSSSKATSARSGVTSQ